MKKESFLRILKFSTIEFIVTLILITSLKLINIMIDIPNILIIFIALVSLMNALIHTVRRHIEFKQIEEYCNDEIFTYWYFSRILIGFWFSVFLFSAGLPVTIEHYKQAIIVYCATFIYDILLITSLKYK